MRVPRTALAGIIVSSTLNFLRARRDLRPAGRWPIPLSYVPIDSYADAQAVMERKRALGGTFIKSYRQPTRRQRQMLIKSGA